jgi:endonuclease-3
MLKEFLTEFGLTKNSNPVKIEEDLLKIVPKEYIKDVNHLFIWHGRNICKAPSPKCDICPIKSYCKFFSKKKTS